MRTRINRSLDANNTIENISPTYATISPSTLGGLAAAFIFERTPLPSEQKSLHESVHVSLGIDPLGRVSRESLPQFEICRFDEMDRHLVAGLASDLSSIAGSLSLTLGPVEIHTNQPQM